MPDKKIEVGSTCFLTGNLYKIPAIEQVVQLRDITARTVEVVGEAEEDEEWGLRWVVRLPGGDECVSEHDLSPMPKSGFYDVRGFQGMRFDDLYGSTCSVQESSLASEAALWIGVDSEGHFNWKDKNWPAWNARCGGNNHRDSGGRMHLSQGQAAALLPILQEFVYTGRT